MGLSIDREKVIKGLSTHKSLGYGCDGCPYEDNDRIVCVKNLCNDAIALLKEQEPKTGVWILDDEDANSWECSECGSLQQIIDGTPYENGWSFCPHCGTKLEEQKMKLE